MRLTVHARRSGRGWSVSVLEEPEIALHCERLTDVETGVRQAAAGRRPTDVEGVEVELVVDLEPVTEQRVARAQRASVRATQAQAAAVDAVRLAVIDMRIQGISVHDIGTLLGLTHQRVRQLERGS